VVEDVVVKKFTFAISSPDEFLVKLLERLVAEQFAACLNASRLLPATQSGFRRGHSPETAITEFSQIFWMPSTAMTLPLSSYSTSPRRLTPWITEFC